MTLLLTGEPLAAADRLFNAQDASFSVLGALAAAEPLGTADAVQAWAAIVAFSDEHPSADATTVRTAVAGWIVACVGDELVDRWVDGLLLDCDNGDGPQPPDTGGLPA